MYSFFEQSPQKLLLNPEKCKNIMNMVEGNQEYDVSFPISIEFHLTNKCNLNCSWCVDKKIRSNCAELPYDVVLQFIEDVEKIGAGITLEGGGEPTIYTYFENVVFEAAKRNISLGLITNGVEAFDWNLVPNFDWIRISVDASTREQYRIEKGADRFEQVLNNVYEMCKKKTINNTLIGIGYVLNKRNREHLIEFISRVDEIGADYIQIRSVEECEDLRLAEQEIQEIHQVIQETFVELKLNILFNTNTDTKNTNNNNLPCIAHSLRSIIHADGSIYLCEKRRHDPIILGNILEDKFSDIWTSENRLNASRKLLNSKNQKGCTVCRITKFNELFYGLQGIKTKNFI